MIDLWWSFYPLTSVTVVDFYSLGEVHYYLKSLLKTSGGHDGSLTFGYAFHHDFSGSHQELSHRLYLFQDCVDRDVVLRRINLVEADSLV